MPILPAEAAELLMSFREDVKEILGTQRDIAFAEQMPYYADEFTRLISYLQSIEEYIDYHSHSMGQLALETLNRYCEKQSGISIEEIVFELSGTSSSNERISLTAGASNDPTPTLLAELISDLKQEHARKARYPN